MNKTFFKTKLFIQFSLMNYSTKNFYFDEESFICKKYSELWNNMRIMVVLPVRRI